MIHCGDRRQEQRHGGVIVGHLHRPDEYSIDRPYIAEPLPQLFHRFAPDESLQFDTVLNEERGKIGIEARDKGWIFKSQELREAVGGDRFRRLRGKSWQKTATDQKRHQASHALHLDNAGIELGDIRIVRCDFDAA